MIVLIKDLIEVKNLQIINKNTVEKFLKEIFPKDTYHVLRHSDELITSYTVAVDLDINRTILMFNIKNTQNEMYLKSEFIDLPNGTILKSKSADDYLFFMNIIKKIKKYSEYRVKVLDNDIEKLYQFMHKKGYLVLEIEKKVKYKIIKSGKKSSDDNTDFDNKEVNIYVDKDEYGFYYFYFSSERGKEDRELVKDVEDFISTYMKKNKEKMIRIYDNENN